MHDCPTTPRQRQQDVAAVLATCGDVKLFASEYVTFREFAPQLVRNHSARLRIGDSDPWLPEFHFSDGRMPTL